MKQRIRSESTASGGRLRAASSLGAALALGALLLTACSSSSATAPTTSTFAARGSTVAVPITTVTVPTGHGTYSYVVVKISVAGGPAIPVQLDTGSTGLVISSAEVGSAAVNTGASGAMDYLSGGTTGSEMTGSVSLGGISSSRSTQFLAVSPNAAFMKGLKPIGVYGILGVAMASDDVAQGNHSPLLQMPAPYWQGLTIKVATSGTGSMVIGPVTEAAGATSLQMSPASLASWGGGVPAYQKDVTMCWTAGSAPTSCGLTDMDLGVGTGPLVNLGQLAGAPILDDAVITPGTPVSIASPSGAPLWSFSAAGSSSPTLVHLMNLGPYTQFNTGIGFFFTHTVAYDVTGGRFLISAPSP